jgi:hypothetical protein
MFICLLECSTSLVFMAPSGWREMPFHATTIGERVWTGRVPRFNNTSGTPSLSLLVISCNSNNTFTWLGPQVMAGFTVCRSPSACAEYHLLSSRLLRLGACGFHPLTPSSQRGRRICPSSPRPSAAWPPQRSANVPEPLPSSDILANRMCVY